MKQPNRPWYHHLLLLSFPPSERIASYALVVSIFTMIFSIAQFKFSIDATNEQLKMNRLVFIDAHEPRLIHTINFDDDTTGELIASICVKNIGQGAAEIIGFDIYYKNQLVKNTLDLVKLMTREELLNCDGLYMTTQWGSILEPDIEKPILKICNETNKSMDAGFIMDSITVVSTYLTFMGDTSATATANMPDSLKKKYDYKRHYRL